MEHLPNFDISTHLVQTPSSWTCVKEDPFPCAIKPLQSTPIKEDPFAKGILLRIGEPSSPESGGSIPPRLNLPHTFILNSHRRRNSGLPMLRKAPMKCPMRLHELSTKLRAVLAALSGTLWPMWILLLGLRCKKMTISASCQLEAAMVYNNYLQKGGHKTY